MKRFLLTLTLALATIPGLTNLIAQESLQPKDAKAKAILDKLSARSKTFKTISADFEYTLQNKDAGIDDTQKGHVWIKGDRYKLELPGLERMSDGKTVWTYLPDDEELQIASMEGDEDGGELMRPSDIFTIYEKGFNYKYDSKTTIDGRSLDVINLYPENGEKPYHTVKLYVDQQEQMIYVIKMLGKDGNIYLYKLKNVELNKDLSDSMFTFNKSQDDLDVIDLR